MANVEKSEIWTIRGVTDETKEKFKAAAKKRRVSIGQLANEALMDAAERFDRSPQAEQNDSGTPSDSIRLLEERVAALEAKVGAPGRSALVSPTHVSEPLDRLVADNDLLLELWRAIAELKGVEEQYLRVETRKLVNLVMVLPVKRALDELLTAVVREVLALSDDVLLHDRIREAIQRAGPDFPMPQGDEPEKVA